MLSCIRVSLISLGSKKRIYIYVGMWVQRTLLHIQKHLAEDSTVISYVEEYNMVL